MLTLSTQLQNRSFHIVERTRMSAKCIKMKITCAKHVKPLFFIVKLQICGILVAVVVDWLLNLPGNFLRRWIPAYQGEKMNGSFSFQCFIGGEVNLVSIKLVKVKLPSQ